MLGTINATARNDVPVKIKPIGDSTNEMITFNYTNTGNADNDATGFIYLKKELDREQVRMCSMYVYCTYE